MARYAAAVQTAESIEKVFAYLSDFSTNEEWDPGTTSARRLDDGPITTGSKFALTARFLGRESDLVYEIAEIDVPRRIVLRGENATVISTDEMTFEPLAGGETRVSYDAELSLKGPLRLFDPLLAIAFRRVGDRALDGMRATLADRTR